MYPEVNFHAKSHLLRDETYRPCFVIISPWKGWGPSFKETKIPYTQGCFVPSLVENWLSGSGKEDLKFSQFIFTVS